MSKIGTKNIKTGGGGGVPKTLQPGNQLCKINSVKLEEFKFIPGAYHLMMSMEGPDQGPDFKGFFVNKDNEAMGRHAGQVGRVKASQWAFADSTTKGGIKIQRDEEIAKFLKNLCTALGCTAWLDAQDMKHDSIEQLVEAFERDKPYKDKFLSVCLAAKEYQSGEHKNYDLYFPKFSKEGVPFEIEGATPSKVLKYDESKHLKKLEEPSTVTSFGSDTKSTGDFSLD